MALHHLYVLFVLFFNCACGEVEPSDLFCTEDCSWDYYTRDNEMVRNECNTDPAKQLAGIDCPNDYGKTSDYVSNVYIEDVTFISVPDRGGSSNGEEQTTLCANISFRVERGALSTMKAIRFTAIPNSYEDQGKVFCQVWDFPGELDTCSFSTGDCSPDGDMQRILFNDCLCDIAPGPDKVHISVDVLPKADRGSQLLSSFKLPTCDKPGLEMNKYCYLTEAERWRPFYASTEQLCDLDSRAINFTFDLAPSGCGIQEYFVFLYKTGRNNTCPSSTGPEHREIVNMATAGTLEQTINNKTVNMTTVIFGNLTLGQHYYVGIKIKDHPPDDEIFYMTHVLCNATLIQIRESPCIHNPCSEGEVCVLDCLEHRCDCMAGWTRNVDGCRKFLPGSSSKSFFIWICSAAFGTLLLCGVFAALIYRVRKKVHGARSADSSMTESVDDSSSMDLPESPSRGSSTPKAIWLICNSNWLLQNFADNLREILQKSVKCKVSLLTVWHINNVTKWDWITEAAMQREKVCFIWDCNLPNLDEFKTDSHMCYEVIEALPKSLSGSAIILQFDLTVSANLPTAFRSYRLPSGLTDLVNEFNGGEVNDNDRVRLDSAFNNIKDCLRKNLCLISEEMWSPSLRKSPDEDQDGRDCEDDEESQLSDGDLSMEEVEVDADILVEVS
uniref:Interleukin-17 receptor-like protein n=1 Tax=Stichopus japonicus TaxID=307972 RepID=A0A8F2EG72_STIJA|nr:interleukin-17 receptor-like protein [Apostichopus japonicus]